MKFIVNNIRSDGELQRARAEAFLLENPDPGVRSRPAAELDRAIETGQALLVSAGPKIVGISLVYQYDPSGAGLVDYEIGTMRVTAAGYGLQAFLGWLHLVQIKLEDDTTRGNVFAVVSPGTASAHNMMTHVGMNPWTPSDTLVLLRRAAGVPFAPDKQVLLADDCAIESAFLKLHLGLLNSNKFAAPKGDATIELAMGWFDPRLLLATSPGNGGKRD